MSTRKAAVPDAWDDDWETAADRSQSVKTAAPVAPKIITKRERKAQHQEENRSLWDAAEKPQDKPIFLQKRDDVPLQADWKPQLKVLSRRPNEVKVLSGMNGLSLQDDDDSEEEERKRAATAFADRKAKADAERVEKQRKYQEARDRIFGASAITASATDDLAGEVIANRSRGQGRGGARTRGVASESRTPTGTQSPSRIMAAQKQLFDPYTVNKSAAESRSSTRSPRPPADSSIIRAPRGPDGSGRGGIGFANRGGRSGLSRDESPASSNGT